MDNSIEIKEILKNAVDIERWVPKTDNTYTFIDEEEVKEIVENILKQLHSRGYKIIKKK
jgi:2C-methyl-D-erythritol 2,4-cyclodiphosphate synthase